MLSTSAERVLPACGGASPRKTAICARWIKIGTGWPAPPRTAAGLDTADCLAGEVRCLGSLDVDGEVTDVVLAQCEAVLAVGLDPAGGLGGGGVSLFPRFPGAEGDKGGLVDLGYSVGHEAGA